MADDTVKRVATLKPSIWYLVIVVLSFYATNTAFNYYTAQTNMSTVTFPKVILFGDSLTQYSFSDEGCWGTIIANKLQRKCDVINRGFSGYNTRWNKLILPRLVTSAMASEVAAITIFLGANDSNNQLNPKQTVPIDEYKQNMIDMVTYLLSIGISKEKIIFIGPPPCDEEKWFKECDSRDPPLAHSKFNRIAGEYAVKLVEAANTVGVPYIDIYTRMSKEEDWQRFLVDGLHFSRAGSEYFETQLWPIVNNLTKDLPMRLPIWNDIDNNNPQALL